MDDQAGYRIQVESSDGLTYFCLALETDEISDVIDELEQTLNGPAQRLERRALENVTLHKKKTDLILNIKGVKFEIAFKFVNIDEVRSLLDHLKRVTHWSRDSSTVVPQIILDYVAEATKAVHVRQVVEQISHRYDKRKLALATEEIIYFIRKYWEEVGVDPYRFNSYPKHILDHLQYIENTTHKTLTEMSQLARIDLLHELTDKSITIALKEKRRRVLYKELNALLGKMGIELPTKLKGTIYETVKTELDPDEIAEFEEA